MSQCCITSKRCFCLLPFFVFAQWFLRDRGLFYKRAPSMNKSLKRVQRKRKKKEQLSKQQRNNKQAAQNTKSHSEDREDNKGAPDVLGMNRRTIICGSVVFQCWALLSHFYFQLRCVRNVHTLVDRPRFVFQEKSLHCLNFTDLTVIFFLSSDVL